jgi:hypothetical protein
LWQKKKRLIGGKEILYIFTIKEDNNNNNNNNVLHLYSIAPFPLYDQRRYEPRQKQENSITKGNLKEMCF